MGSPGGQELNCWGKSERKDEVAWGCLGMLGDKVQQRAMAGGEL